PPHPLQQIHVGKEHGRRGPHQLRSPGQIKDGARQEEDDADAGLQGLGHGLDVLGAGDDRRLAQAGNKGRHDLPLASGRLKGGPSGDIIIEKETGPSVWKKIRNPHISGRVGDIGENPPLLAAASGSRFPAPREAEGLFAGPCARPDGQEGAGPCDVSPTTKATSSTWTAPSTWGSGSSTGPGKRSWACGPRASG